MSLYSTDYEVLLTASNWLNTGHNIALVTVVQTWGSSPRPQGSHMIMRKDGVHTGSVSGGCVEEDIVTRFRNNELSENFPTMVSYGADREEAIRYGLPCGGRLELLVELLESPASIGIVLQKIAAGQLVVRRVCLQTGEVSLHPATAVDRFEYNIDYIKKVYGPDWHLLLIGAGHLSRYVARIAMMLNYRVSVCDPRDEYRLVWDIEGVNLLDCMPDDAVHSLENNPCTIIVALTHDPILDDMAMMDALVSNAFYVGSIGSRKTSEHRRMRLLELGVPSHQLARLHAPVGLPIGSHTPPEIAVSILAEITAARNNALCKAHAAITSA